MPQAPIAAIRKLWAIASRPQNSYLRLSSTAIDVKLTHPFHIRFSALDRGLANRCKQVLTLKASGDTFTLSPSFAGNLMPHAHP